MGSVCNIDVIRSFLDKVFISFLFVFSKLSSIMNTQPSAVSTSSDSLLGFLHQLGPPHPVDITTLLIYKNELLILDEGNSMLTLSTRSTKDTDLAKLEVFFQEAMGNKAGLGLIEELRIQTRHLWREEKRINCEVDDIQKNEQLFPKCLIKCTKLRQKQSFGTPLEGKYDDLML
ncbi:hypothetical protein MJT46_008198 [Ovis ammon polii x Ovis aries]|nr:hypothetical protein MJT46_008198 [Ovis ammon polii x Ovis aries]